MRTAISLSPLASRLCQLARLSRFSRFSPQPAPQPARQRALRTSLGLALAVAAALGLAPGVGSAAPAPGDSIPCRAQVSVAPGRAVVGQQLVHRVVISRRAASVEVRWARAPSFPGFRSERLPAGPEEQLAGDPLPFRRVERRALFGASPGRRELPEATLLCVDRDGTGERRFEVALAGPSLELDPLPMDASGSPLVGRVHARLIATPSHIALGEAVQLSLSLRGEANVWALPSPLGAEHFGESVEFFRGRSQLELEPGDRLVARRFDRAELVPRRAGTLILAPIEVAYFDPDAGRFVRTSTETIEIEVREPLVPATVRKTKPSPRGAVARESARPEGAPSGRDSGGVALLTVLAAIVGGGLGWWHRQRAAPWRRVDRHLSEAAAENTPGQRRHALEAALRAALEIVEPGSGDRTPSEIAASADREPLREIARLLSRLEESRYGGPDAAPPPHPFEVAAAVDGLRSGVLSDSSRAG